ncbi:MAG: PQQ-dependent dehydrogenase, methanol/ethanol family [Gemmatimonadota bacterium]
MESRVSLILVLLAMALPSTLNGQEIGSEDVLAGLSNPARWLSYSGDYTGQRHSPLAQVTAANVEDLEAQWTFQTGVSGHKFEATPIVVDGILYVTGPMNNAWAIDGKTGRELWRYQYTLPPREELRVCCGMVNRGFAIHGDRLYMNTLDAHLVALDRETGEEVWNVELANHEEGYASTGAPLIVDDKLIVGISGGEYAIRGFLDAYDPDDGSLIWRFYTIPGPGQPGHDTWPAEIDSWERGGGPTWLTGTYDPDLNLLFWTTGNPNPDFYGDDRTGDNLYTNSLIALDLDTGTLRWHYQFTPFDEHDWDANQIPMLVNTTVDGRQRQVVMVANRNGFFYLLDRATGQYLNAFAYINQTWAEGIGDDGRPIEIPGQRPTPEGTLTCPDLFGGTNFMSPSYDASLGLFYVTARETCQIYISTEPPENYKAGDRTMGGSARFLEDGRYGALRAINPLTGETVWELTHPTPSWAGIVSTAGGVVFSGDNEGYFIAADSRTGQELFRYQMGAPIYAAPTTYTIDGRQYVTLVAGAVVTSFALPQ